jgi:D-threo-aldose 1-dehydrogenase
LVGSVIALPRHGLGTAPLGGLFREVDDDVAVATVHAAIDVGWTFVDTAPLYGHGLAEARLGRALANATVPVVVSSKVGRVLDPGTDPTTIFHGVPPVVPRFDFSASGVRRSLEESLERLGLDRLDIAFVHDPDDHETDAVEHAFPALQQARDEGLVGAIGCGMNQVEMLSRFVEHRDDLGVDVILVAGRWTLLDRQAAPLLDRCGERGVAVVVGGVFNSGVLAETDPATATFDYLPADDRVLARARSMAAACAAHHTTLQQAALAFPWRHPAVTSVVVGARTPVEAHANAASSNATIPAQLWDQLDRC